MKALNMVTDDVLEFDEGTWCGYAVRYGHAQDTNRMSLLFSLVHNNDVAGMDKHFPLTFGKKSVSIGDWGAFHNGNL